MKIKKVERPFIEGNIMMVGYNGIVKIEGWVDFREKETRTSYKAFDKDGNIVMEFVNGEFDIEYFIEKPIKQ